MTADWRPLSARASEEAARAYDKLQEGIPAHLAEALKYWLFKRAALPLATEYRQDRNRDERRARALLRDFEVKSGRRVPVDHRVEVTLGLLFDNAGPNVDLLLDVLDYVAHLQDENASSLKLILDQGRSAWTVDTESRAMVRRVPGAESALAAVAGLPGAGALLHSAWAKAYGLHPDPTAAYDEALRAVEAAFCSAILPKATLPTLGTVIEALKDDPAKLQHVWPASNESGQSAAETARTMMELLWRNQGWGHGSDGSKGPEGA